MARARKVIGAGHRRSPRCPTRRSSSACGCPNVGGNAMARRRRRRHPAVAPLRPADRGGPDRGGGPAVRLRAARRCARRCGRGDDAPGARGPAAGRGAQARRAARDYQEVDQLQLRRAPLDDAPFGDGLPPIRLLNPIAAQIDVMRTTLWGGLIETCATTSIARPSRVRLFEVGRVFLRDASIAAGPALQVQAVSPAAPARRCWRTVRQLDEQWGASAARGRFLRSEGRSRGRPSPVPR